MQNVSVLASLWIGLALVATLLAIWFKISTAVLFHRAIPYAVIWRAYCLAEYRPSPVHVIRITA